jgi:hypothetical protein
MSKKHFIALADAIRRANEDPMVQFQPSQLDVLANFCKSVNPAFKYDRWIDYINGECGPNGGKR